MIRIEAPPISAKVKARMEQAIRTGVPEEIVRAILECVRDDPALLDWFSAGVQKGYEQFEREHPCKTKACRKRKSNS